MSTTIFRSKEPNFETAAADFANRIATLRFLVVAFFFLRRLLVQRRLLSNATAFQEVVCSCPSSEDQRVAFISVKHMMLVGICFFDSHMNLVQHNKIGND